MKDTVGTTIATPLYTAGVTVRIKLKETTQIGDEAFLQAMLDCLHLKDPYAKIIPKPTEQEETQILHFAICEHEDINNTDNFDVYIDDPIRKKNKEYAARIHVETSIPLYQILGDDKVQSWLKEEKVHLEENNLQHAHLVNVGFLFQTHARADSMKLYEARLKDYLQESEIDFHIIKTTIYTDMEQQKDKEKFKHQIKAKILMIRAAGDDAYMLTQEITSLNAGEVTFYPWKEYMSLSSEQKRTIVMDQRAFQQDFKTFCQRNFTKHAKDTVMFSSPTNDDERMDHEELSEEEDTFERETPVDLTKTNVVDFIQEHYKTSTGKNLFTYVHQPIECTIEVILPSEYFIKAQECMKQMQKDIQYYSNSRTQNLIFQQDNIQTSNLASYKPWKPFKLNSQVK